MISQHWPLSFHQTGLTPLLSEFLDRAMGLKKAEQLYRLTQADCATSTPDLHFVPALHRRMGIRSELQGDFLNRVPHDGPLVVVANHPFGGIETTILLESLLMVRPDVKFMANYLLRKLPETQDRCIYVDPFGTESSRQRNISSMREARGWLKSGHALCVFPAGAVSHFSLKTFRVADPEWKENIGKFIRGAVAPVLPVYVDGRNSLLFQILGTIHPMCRTALLVREFVRKRGCTVRLTAGRAIPSGRLAAFPTDRELISYLRTQTYRLQR